MEVGNGTPSLSNWLESLDLLQYLQNFYDVGIYDLEDCVTLDSDFLNDIGIQLLGHRKRIMEHLPLINISKYHEEHSQAKTSATLPPNYDSHFMYPSLIKGEGVAADVVPPTRSRSEKRTDNGAKFLTSVQKCHPPISPTTPTELPQRCSPQNVELPHRIKSPPSKVNTTKEQQIFMATPPVPVKRGVIPLLLQETEQPKPKPIPMPRKTLENQQKMSSSTSDLPSHSVHSPTELLSQSMSILGVTNEVSCDVSGDSFEPIKSASSQPLPWQQSTSQLISPPDLDISFVPGNSCKSDRQSMSDVYMNVDDNNTRNGGINTDDVYEPIWYVNSGLTIHSTVPVSGTDLFGHSTDLTATTTSNTFDFEDNMDDGVYANVLESSTPPKTMTTNTNRSSGLSQLDLDFFTNNSTKTCTSSTPNWVESTESLLHPQTVLTSSIGVDGGGSSEVSFEMPPPDFPPPPFPPPPPPNLHDDLSILCSNACDTPPSHTKPAVAKPKGAMPPVPPRRTNSSLSSSYVNIIPGQLIQTDSPGQQVQSAWPMSKDNPPAELCFTPNKKPFPQSIDYSFASTPQKHKLQESMKLPSLSTPGPDPFQDDDPFSDFGTECARFNEDNTGVDNSAAVYEFAQEGDSGDFDPFGLGNSKRATSSNCHYSLSDIPPPPPCSESLDDPGRLYPHGYSTNESTDESMSDLGDEPDDSSSPPVIPANRVDQRPISIISEDGIQGQRRTGRAGSLYKQGGVKGNKGWRKRWVIFDGKSLRYYSNSKSQVSKRIVPVTCMKKVDNLTRANATFRYKFNVETKNRIFQFAAETSDDCAHWCSILMAAIIALASQPPDTLHEGGDMYSPDKEGWIKFERYHRSLFVVLKEGHMCYYNKIEDFKIASPIHDIDMKMASVKEMTRSKLRLATHYTQFMLSFETYEENVTWRMAIEESIALALGNDTILDQIKENPSNQECADCAAPDPHWGSINLGIVLCKKCAGIHRGFDLNVSKVRSLRMDTSVWSPSLIEMMKQIGNYNANLFWEKTLRAKSGFNQDMEAVQRKQHLENKYQERKYIDKHPLSGSKPALSEELLKAASTSDVLLTMMLIFSGADVKCIRPGTEEETAFSIAKAAGQRLQMELLYQNGGDLESIRLYEDQGKEREKRIRGDVRTQGYLLKTGSDKKDFLKRFCILEHGCLRYFTSEKSVTTKGIIDHEHMLCIQATPTEKSVLSIKAPIINHKMEITNRYPEAFELSTNCSAGSRVYLFAAASPEEKMTWMRKIAQLICPLPVMDEVPQSDFTLAGNFYVKEGLASAWQEAWVMVNHKQVMLYMVKDMKLSENVDIRKAVNIKYHDSDIVSSCASTQEKGRHFVVDLPSGRAFYFQANLQKDTERLYNAIHTGMASGGDTLVDQQLTADDVPIIVDKCIKFIEEHALREEGIYRQAATNSKVDSLLKAFAADAHAVKLEIGVHTVHEVANALKRFFRNLKDPLLLSRLYDTWIEKSLEPDTYCKGKISATSTKLHWYRYNIEGLPIEHRRTLRQLIIHLAKLSRYSDENKMTVENIATSFGATLVKVGSEAVNPGVLMGAEGGQNIAYEMRIIGDIINNYEQLFELEKEKEDMIKEGEKRLENLQKQARITSIRKSAYGTSIKVSVHFFSHSGQSEIIDVDVSTTPEQVMTKLLAKFNLHSGEYVLHETVCHGALERLLYPQEPLYTIVMAWSGWRTDYRETACLCLKPFNLLVDKIESSYEPGKGQYLEVKFSTKKEKTFSKFLFEFTNSKLTYCKNAKMSTKPINSWNVEDLAIYVGVDPERKTAKFPITFMKKGESDKVGSKEMPYFGHSLSFGSEKDQMTWAATMIKAQNPGSLKT